MSPRRCSPLLVLGALLVVPACHSTVIATMNPDMATAGNPIQINKIPTGSIQTPSLCERVTVDQRISTGGVTGFAFVWATDHYQVVYEDTATQDIFSMTLGLTGNVMTQPVLVEQTASPSSEPAIVQTDSGFVVAWQEEATPSLHVHALDATGKPTGTGHDLATTRSSQIRPVLSSSPSGIAVAWMDQDPTSAMDQDNLGTSTTYIGLLDSNLALRTDVPQQQVDSADQTGYPWLAGDANSLALMTSDTISGQTDVTAATIAAPLTLATPVDIRGDGGVNSALLGRLLLTSFGYLATWEDHRSGEAEIYMSLLKPDGTRYAGGLVEEPDTGNANWSHQAWTGATAAVVYYQFRAGKPQIFMTFIDQTGARIGGAADAQVSNTTSSAKFPDIQWSGGTFGVLWIDDRDGMSELYFNSAHCDKPAPI